MSNLVLKSYIEEFAGLMALETYKLIKAESKSKKQKIDREISTKFLKYFIKKIVFDSLTDLINKDMTNKEAYKVTKASFLDIKIKIQEEISKGFEDAFFDYARQQVDYYTVIDVMPEPINKVMI